MNKEIIINFGRKIGFTIKKYSPEILMGLGITGGIGSVYLACKATTKVEGIIEKKKEFLDEADKLLQDETVEYTEEDAKKDIKVLNIKTNFEIIKNYAPSLVLGGLSIASILTSHNIMKKRSLALAAAYTAVDNGFKNYRNNVVDRFGEEIDKELRYNIKEKTVEQKYIDKKGKEKVKEEKVKVVDTLSGISEYARFFDEANIVNPSFEYRKDPEYNKKYLMYQQRLANDMLRARGHLFLNEVYDMLGFDRSRAGQIVGWTYDKNIEQKIDFGIFDLTGLSDKMQESKKDFVNGKEYTILLDFNVDGPIYLDNK
jgi:hypothetical protein